MYDFANTTPRVDCSRNQYTGLLQGGRTILSGIDNSSHRVDCFRKRYRLVRKNAVPGEREIWEWETRDVGIASFHVNKT